ncbi:carbon storage regulator CsrA [Paraclostridium bifermentans]|uniref:Translational regulator CsrA n=1 Tax=Paraclostridium bifermentans ATCC 638 = DSM 14991 TaxID=1233171 RepID=T4VSB0_PARBF|nr:carbon storage regulator CsrA [Paraclostridium bifermentans]EQK43636.1 carbon storage regulator [[Clostridium] bifermentans ATCC 638] [Paraclostridium bifermentans ATCC 638 = DSM 14991]RIZ59659.1 carbon storage regulator [Paraclostridium bifermentans]TQO58827.1 carbon storage regulator [Paraclostridium bifermentans]UAG17479.1 carbon storage regulator CsrA [Paraclostridium bifermentans]UOW67200.1 carbon storage regulator CsrA [Paraclostridium bifermentans]
MLVVTRKKGESILIGDDIEIKVTKIDDGSVKIAIDAPKSMTILRKEVYEKVKEENKNATSSNLDLLELLK